MPLTEHCPSSVAYRVSVASRSRRSGPPTTCIKFKYILIDAFITSTRRRHMWGRDRKRRSRAPRSLVPPEASYPTNRTFSSSHVLLIFFLSASRRVGLVAPDVNHTEPHSFGPDEHVALPTRSLPSDPGCHPPGDDALVLAVHVSPRQAQCVARQGWRASRRG